MSRQQFTMIDDEESTFKLKFESPDKSMYYQEYMISKGYEHHQDEPNPSVFVYVWEESQKIGVFKNEKEFNASGCK